MDKYFYDKVRNFKNKDGYFRFLFPEYKGLPVNYIDIKFLDNEYLREDDAKGIEVIYEFYLADDLPNCLGIIGLNKGTITFYPDGINEKIEINSLKEFSNLRKYFSTLKMKSAFIEDVNSTDERLDESFSEEQKKIHKKLDSNSYADTKKIIAILYSDFTSKEISDGIKLSEKTIEKYRYGKRSIENMNLPTGCLLTQRYDDLIGELNA